MAESVGLLEALIDALRCLPGVGPKSAQRMAFHVLERDRAGAQRLADTMIAALAGIGRCSECRNLTEDEVCRLCRNANRDDAVLCVVESPADLFAIEQTGVFSGKFYVLMGHLSPLDGVGPEQLGLDRLEARLAEGRVRELIIATNPTAEGEATAHYISQMAQEKGVQTSRIAHGVPVGGELEFVDGTTLGQALLGRRKL